MPRELATLKETFDQLAADFRLDPNVPETIVKLGCQSLSDFRYYVHDESELQAFILDQCGDPVKKDRVQLARLRHAWAACVQFKRSKEQRQTDLAPDRDGRHAGCQNDLLALKLGFFQRYHLV